MKKVLIVLALTIVSTSFLKAQDKTSPSANIFSVGLEAALPIGTFGDFYSFGIGGSVQGEHKISTNTGLTLNLGYITYSVKSSLGSGHFGVIPVLAGVKQYFSSSIYGQAQLGAAFGTTSGSGTNFTYSPGIGFILGKNFDVLVKFVGISGGSGGGSLNSIGARLAYDFGQ